MIKTNIALAAVMMALAFSPAEAATQPQKAKTSKTSKSGKAGKTAAKQSTKAKSTKGTKSAKGTKEGKAAKAAPALAAAPAESRADRQFNALSGQFLTALWRMDPETAISVGKYDTAGTLTVPDMATRQLQLAFIDDWLGRFGKIDTRQLSARQRTDMALLVNKLNSDRWYLTTFREFEWNPAVYNVASAIDYILHTDYAAKSQRLRTLLRRIANVPAYYEAARNNISNPTREHTQLAIAQAPGVIALLDELDKEAQSSNLAANEKGLFAQRIASGKTAVEAYAAWLGELDKHMAATGNARSFRIGKDLYEQKFAFDIQSASTGEQTYQKALAAREQLLANMDRISDELWPKYLADVAKPADRFAKIGMMIDKLSANHVPREQFFNEIKLQIPKLQEWVTKNDLLTLDADKPLVVRETPAYQRGVAGASIEAPGPYRPQDRTYYNVTPLDGATPEQAESSLREYNHWILQILNMHEAIPGHYAQLVYANKSPSIVKSIFGNGAMVEGWAVYSERMMLESGYDNSPEMWLMYSKWNLRSVTNTILDYSVQVLNMQQPEAIDLLTRQAFQTQQEAAEKWRRATLTSVQLTSYFSGYSEIMELREQQRNALGTKFSLKRFNEEFLGYGSAPVKVIRELMQ